MKRKKKQKKQAVVIGNIISKTFVVSISARCTHILSLKLHLRPKMVLLMQFLSKTNKGRFDK